jgi:hypothetical protein
VRFIGEGEESIDVNLAGNNEVVDDLLLLARAKAVMIQVAAVSEAPTTAGDAEAQPNIVSDDAPQQNRGSHLEAVRHTALCIGTESVHVVKQHTDGLSKFTMKTV